LLVFTRYGVQPVLCRPIELGADFVLHSATKYLGGHTDVLAGTLHSSFGTSV
jgi:cystathionine beta-lyase/cystathionine gamma-synthase